MMKINIENCIRNSEARDGYMFTLQELVKHLKELKKRTDEGDMSALKEFFDIYVFDKEIK